MLHKPLLVYLADDDEEDSMFFKEALNEVNVEIHIEDFNNGVTLMDTLLKKKNSLPDVIYLDLNMPLMNGEECLDDIKTEPQLSKIPIIIYSTYVDDSLADILRKKGANWYLVKPNSFEKLKNLLQKSLQYITTLRDLKSTTLLEEFIITE